MKIGPYEVVSRIGQGGAGSVHLARSPDGREVAIKLLHRRGSESGRLRFEREQRLQEELGEAEGFVPLLDSGSCPQGPYIVMPFLAGGTLRDRLRGGPLSIDDALAVGRALARAVGRAHERGIVHRDLKPENVLFAARGREGIGKPLVSDLGLAKRFESGESSPGQSQLLSEAGEMLGTALYSAREQLADAKGAGPQADVFSIGAILYECLAGVPAFDGSSLPEVVTRIESGVVEPLASVRPETPTWLARVVERALLPDREARFEDGRALARALEGERPARARRGLVVIGGLALAAGAAVVSTVAVVALSSGTPSPDTKGAASSLASTKEPGKAEPPRSSTKPPATSAKPPLPAVEHPEVPPAHRPLLDGKRVRLERLFGSYAGRHEGHVFRVAFAPSASAGPDGKRAVSASADGFVRVWDLPGLGDALVLNGHAGSVNDISVSQDGTLLVTAGEDASVKLWSLETGSVLKTCKGHEGPVYTAAISPDGKLAASGSKDGTIRVWDFEAMKSTSILRGHKGAVIIVALSSDGRRILSGGDDSTVRLWDRERGELRSLSGHAGKVQGLAFLPGERAVSAATDGKLKVWSLETGEALRTIDACASGLAGLAVSRDGARVASAGTDGLLRLWDVESGKELLSWAHDAAVSAVDLSPDGKLALSGSADGALRLFDIASGNPLPRAGGHAGPVSAIAWSPDGQRALSSAADLTGRIWDAESGREVGALTGKKPLRGTALAWSPNGKRAFEGGSDGSIVFWAMPEGKELSRNPAGTKAVTSVVFSKDGKKVAAGNQDGSVIAWELVTGRSILNQGGGHASGVSSVAISPDGSHAISAGFGGLFLSHDLATWAVVALRTRGAPGFAALSPDGKQALGGGADGRLHVVDVDSTKEIVALAGSGPAKTTSVSLLPEAKRVVVAGDGQIFVWDLSSGELIDRIELPQGDAALTVALAPDGRSFLAGSARGPLLRFALLDAGSNR